MTMDTFCESPVPIKTQGDNANAILTSDRRDVSDALAESLEVLKIDSTINDSAYYNSNQNDAKSDPLLATHTSDRKKKKLLILTIATEILHKNY